MESGYKKTLEEWFQWYNWNHSMLRNADVDKKVAFLDKAVHGLFAMIAATAEEGERVEMGRDKPISIILPVGIHMDEPIRRSDA